MMTQKLINEEVLVESVRGILEAALAIEKWAVPGGKPRGGIAPSSAVHLLMQCDMVRKQAYRILSAADITLKPPQEGAG